MSTFPSRLPAREFALPLLAWYDANRRALPWRENHDWYRVWISEIMLQQTTVKAVLPYFEAFVRAFPDVKALAVAQEAEVLGFWAGLGYYSRARNLHKTAQLICSEHQARFPADFAVALALPGIGRYTAGAILSIAYGLPFPVIDGNVRRVAIRYVAHAGEWNEASNRALWNLLSTVVNDKTVGRRVGDFNQALMELGATICTPARPACSDCPIATSCEALRLGLQDSIPQRKRTRPAIAVAYTAALVRNQECFLMSRTEAGPFPRGLWEFPRVVGVPRETASGFQARGLQIEIREELGRVIHAITHHRITVHVVEACLAGETIPDGWAWIDPLDQGVGLSAYVKKVLKLATPSLRGSS